MIKITEVYSKISSDSNESSEETEDNNAFKKLLTSSQSSKILFNMKMMFIKIYNMKIKSKMKSKSKIKKLEVN